MLCKKRPCLHPEICLVNNQSTSLLLSHCTAQNHNYCNWLGLGTAGISQTGSLHRILPLMCWNAGRLHNPCKWSVHCCPGVCLLGSLCNAAVQQHCHCQTCLHYTQCTAEMMPVHCTGLECSGCNWLSSHCLRTGLLGMPCSLLLWLSHSYRHHQAHPFPMNQHTSKSFYHHL